MRRPGAREGWALAEDRAERARQRGLRGTRRWRAALRDLGVQAARPGLARTCCGLPATRGWPWAEDPGPAPLGLAGSADPALGSGARPMPGPWAAPVPTPGARVGVGTCPWAAVKPGREHLKVCWKMIDCGWCLLATVFLILKPPGRTSEPPP